PVKPLARNVTPHPAPSVPWQVTGNHWLAVPCIHPANGSIHLLSVLHAGSLGGVELAGSPSWADGRGPALLQPLVEVDGQPVDLGASGMAWERSVSWIPSFACLSGDLAIHGTLFCPVGRDADMPGLVYLLSFENRGTVQRDVSCSMRGVLGSREVRVRTGRS